MRVQSNLGPGYVSDLDPTTLGATPSVGDFWFDLTVPPGSGLPAYGTYQPDSSTTGIPAGTVLRTYPSTGGPGGAIVSGTLTITTPGVVLDAYDFHCRILVAAANVTIRRSRVRGNSTLATNSALIDCNNANVVNCVVEDCLLVPDNPSIWWDGIVGHDYTASRVEAYHVVDGFGIFNTHGPNANVAIFAPYVHDLAFLSPDPNHSGDPTPSSTHNDCIQIQGGLNITILGGNFQAFAAQDILSRDGSAGADILRGASGSGATGPNSLGGYNRHFPNLLGQPVPNLQVNSAIQITANVSPVGNVTIDQNWFDGGFYTLNIAAALSNSSATGNQFGHNSAGDSGTPDTGNNTTHTIVGGGSAFQSASSANTYEDNGHAITMR